MEFLTELKAKLDKIEMLEERLNRLEAGRVPQYIPQAEWQRKYNVCTTTLWKLRKQGLVNFQKIGKKVYILDVFPKEESKGGEKQDNN